MKYIFLVNSFGLKKKTDDIIKRIKLACNELEIDYVIEVNSADVSTEDIIEKYKNTKNIIFAVGGDGIINRVLNNIVGTKNILGYIPAGTGNDFYKTNKEELDTGINKIDLVKINDRYFINIACFGIDADIGNNDEIIHSKIIPESQRYNIGVLYHFLKFKARKMNIIIGDESFNQEFTTVVVCNGRYYGGGYKIGPNSSLNDGLLDVYLVDKLNKLEIAKLLVSMKSGSHEYDKHVKKIRTDKVLIESEKSVSSNVDGEKITDTNFDIELIENGISVYYNQELIDKVLRKKK